MSFVQHIQVIIFPENLSQNKSEEENEKKTMDFAIPIRFLKSSGQKWRGQTPKEFNNI
jgi:hypothetical protein